MFASVTTPTASRRSQPDLRLPPPDAAVPECLQSYLREIVQFPLITPSEERALAQRSARGDEEARRQLVASNLRLVVKVAARYAEYGIQLCDLIQEGNLGLIRAAERFDWRRGTRFSTYAVYWIREAVTRALTSAGRPVRLTGHAFKRFRQMSRTIDELEAKLLREPTIQEVAAAMHSSADRLSRIVMTAAFPLSLENFRPGDANGTGQEDLACDCACDPAELIRDEPSAEQLKDALHDALDRRERWIVIHSFGLDGHRPWKLREMARQLGVSVERVRQIRERSLSTLRHHLVGIGS